MDQVQNTILRMTWGLVVCSAIVTTSAWADKKIDVDKSHLRLRDLKQMELFEQSMADDRRGNPDVPKLPTLGEVPKNFRVQYHVIVVGSDQPMVTTKGVTLEDALHSQGNAIPGEKIVYSNTLYDLSNLSELHFKRPGSGYLIADDIGTELVEDCDLTRVRIAVNGGVPGGGDNFKAFINLYDGCPESGGIPIPGTSHATPFLDSDKAIIHVLDLIFPRFANDPLPSAPPDFYLGIKFNRDEAGWLFGNPPERGYSKDTFSLSNFNCTLSAGGFPTDPHASFYAVVFAADTCETEFVAYQAVSDVATAVEIGQGNLWAEDLTLALGDQACEISSLEIGFRATGVQPYSVDVDMRGLGDTQGLPGTLKQFVGEGGNQLEVARFRYEPGIFLPAEPWVTFSTSRDGVGIVRPGEAQAGSSASTFRIIVDDGMGGIFWSEPRCLSGMGGPAIPCPQPDPQAAIFYVRVKCRGDTPLGTCCPSQKVPTVCEGGPTPGKSCETDGDCAGGQCVFVDTPCTSSDDCPLGSQCLSTCQGGIHDGLTCFTDNDCVSASAPFSTGTCVGAKICDRAVCFDDVAVLGCLNGRWQALNASATNRCADNPFDPPCGSHACCLPDDSVRDLRYEQCLRIKDPYSPIAECGRCLITGSRCFADNHCTTVGDSCVPNDAECSTGQFCQDNGICAPRTAIWHPGSFEVQDDFSCPFYACNFGISDCFEGQPEISCSFSFPSCPPGFTCKYNTCILAGCENPICCNLVCRKDNFCCDAFWDFNCARQAEELCPFVLPRNDDCFCKTCSGVPFRCHADADCGLNADGSARTCDLDTDVCGAKELLFVEPNTGGLVCTTYSTKCIAFGESSNESATATPHDPIFCCNKFGPIAAVGTIWYRFTMPNVSGATSARFQTCNTTDIHATDSIIQIYVVGDNTDLETSCGSLMTIGCNDDAGGSCGPNGRLSDTCVEGLIPGHEYFISLASPVANAGGKFRLEVEIPCSLGNAPPANNECALAEAFNSSAIAYDLNNASISCPTVDQCPSFLFDVWFDYTPECTGTLTIDTCGGGETNLPTAVAVYEVGANDDCPPDPVADFLGCSEVPCASVSVPVIGDTNNKLYRIRVGSTSLNVPVGTLSITCTQQDCNYNGIPDSIDIANCPPNNPRCADCNNNQIPDFCDIRDCPTGDVTCGDCNINDVPDSCELASCPVGDVTCDDCNTNGVLDSCDMINCPAGDVSCDDCNTNGVPDVCDIANGEPDDDGNGVPDTCECSPPPLPQSWTSIGQHGPGCLFDPACGGHNGAEYGLDIPADGGFSEPRSTGINKIIVAYDIPVDVSRATVSTSGCDVNGNPQNLSGITMSVVTGANPNEAVLMFNPSLPGNNPQKGETPVKYDITISGVACGAGGASIADETRTVWAIFGDANSSPIIVNNGDLGYVRSARDVILARPAQPQILPDSPTGVYEIRSDINNDNTVSNGDIGLVRVARDSITQPSGLCP